MCCNLHVCLEVYLCRWVCHNFQSGRGVSLPCLNWSNFIACLGLVVPMQLQSIYVNMPHLTQPYSMTITGSVLCILLSDESIQNCFIYERQTSQSINRPTIQQTDSRGHTEVTLTKCWHKQWLLWVVTYFLRLFAGCIGAHFRTKHVGTILKTEQKTLNPDNCHPPDIWQMTGKGGGLHFSGQYLLDIYQMKMVGALRWSPTLS